MSEGNLPVPIVVLGAFILGCYITAVVWFKRKPNSLARLRTEWLSGMPVEEARLHAERLLADPEMFTFSPLSKGWVEKFRTRVPPAVFDLWSRLGAPRTLYPPLARLAPHVCRPVHEAAEWLSNNCRRPPGEGLVLLGYRGSNGYLLGSAASETIYELIDMEVFDETVTASGVREYPTVYHWIISLTP